MLDVKRIHVLTSIRAENWPWCLAAETLNELDDASYQIENSRLNVTLLPGWYQLQAKRNKEDASNKSLQCKKSLQQCRKLLRFTAIDEA